MRFDQSSVSGLVIATRHIAGSRTSVGTRFYARANVCICLLTCWFERPLLAVSGRLLPTPCGLSCLREADLRGPSWRPEPRKRSIGRRGGRVTCARACRSSASRGEAAGGWWSPVPTGTRPGSGGSCTGSPTCGPTARWCMAPLQKLHSRRMRSTIRGHQLRSRSSRRICRIGGTDYGNDARRRPRRRIGVATNANWRCVPDGSREAVLLMSSGTSTSVRARQSRSVRTCTSRRCPRRRRGCGTRLRP